jgi:esterase/lipase superfamily enzyme
LREEYAKWYSHTIGRDFEMLVFGHAGYPVILFPTSMGRFYQNKDFGLIESVRWFVEQGLVRIYCPDSIDTDSWYNKQVHPSIRAYNHTLYDVLIREEVVKRALYECNTGKVALAGCSFGAYHATNFGLRYPEMTGFIFNMGGAFDIRRQVGEYYDDNVYFNNPPDFLPGSQHSALWEMLLVWGVGEHDFCRPANEKMAHIASHKQLRSWLDIRPGGVHDWWSWKEMFPHYLSLIFNH